jgi:methionyl-tRNA formyltransferase
MSRPLKIVFAGTPEFSVAPLLALLQSEHEVVAVYTQPDRPAGRGRKLTASPVKQVALDHKIPVEQPLSLRDESAQTILKNYEADVMIVVAYGLILPKVVLDMPTFGCLNIHASLLPKWRGAAPIQRAIEAGDDQTGITIMQMDIGLDTGDMLFKSVTDITPSDNTQTLHDRLSIMGSEALMQTLSNLSSLQSSMEQQDESLVTYAEKLQKAEAQMNWEEPADVILRKIQAFNPYPVAFCHYQNQPLRIWQARAATHEELSYSGQPAQVVAVNKQGIYVQTVDKIICFQQVQPPSKKAMNAYDFAQSRNLVGEFLQ